MFGIILSIILLGFGVFLRATTNPGFATSKKYGWVFIGLGILTLAGKIAILYSKGEL